ncbi:MAG: hypothetical protein ACT4N2_01155 [Hyphomicrobium sp.]
MTIFVKTLKAGQLPEGWQKELGLAADKQVRVAIEEVRPKRSPEEIEEMLERLRQIKPVKIDGDITEFIRSERERIDGRNLR